MNCRDDESQFCTEKYHFEIEVMKQYREYSDGSGESDYLEQYPIGDKTESKEVMIGRMRLVVRALQFYQNELPDVLTNEMERELNSLIEDFDDLKTGLETYIFDEGEHNE